ncbi:MULTISPECIES: hypothetical protein [Alicyclobacillus]|uniref:hypothetical protein n=1 Tax=Alicyclobacillus TaxID=29330 RepID=UPI001EE43D31|nr:MULTISPECIES: hypothetical protein [Alicyclobacillus]
MQLAAVTVSPVMGLIHSQKEGRERMREFFSPTFAIGTLRIGQIEGASCLNMGNNWPSHFRSYKKTNQGFGSVSGDHAVLKDMKSFLHDPDILDHPGNVERPTEDWLQQMLQRMEAHLPKAPNQKEDVGE